MLEEQIAAKYSHSSPIEIAIEKTGLSPLAGQISEMSERIYRRHEIENGEQPEKIADALMECKEQMLVRDNCKPEYFLKEFGLSEDEKTFGFVNQVKKNRLTKHAIDLFFITASSLFLAYFKSRVSVVSTEVSGLLRGRNDAV